MDAEEASADEESSEEARSIGARAKYIRLRRGLSLNVAAGLAGISKPYLSLLENGHRGFNRRGLLEDLAAALGCSVADLTGQPYLPPDRESAAAIVELTGVSAALHDSTLDDVPDIPTRSVDDLVRAAAEALANADDVQFARTRGLGALITELHVLAVTADADGRRKALAGLVEACIAARALAGTLGHVELAVSAARRGYDAARRLERSDLVGLTAMGRTMTLGRIGARRRAYAIASETLAELSSQPGPTSASTEIAEACGMLHLSAALVSAREGRTDVASTHLGEARSLAAHTGECNHVRFHFGPTNVAAWDLSIAVETDAGPEAAERFTALPIDLSVFGSRDREVSVHFDLARAWAQAEGDRDAGAIRHIDTADRIAPVRMRNDPIAKDLVEILDRRAKHRTWELNSLCNRFGIRSKG